VASLLAILSIFIGLILIINSGGAVSKAIGLVGLGTGIPAILRSIRSIRDLY
jgi:hypothetical protein